MKGKILPGKVLLKKATETITKAGIIIPSTVKIDDYIAVVVMYNPIEKLQVELNVGDKVMYSRHAVTENNKITIDDEEYLLLNVMDIQYIFS